MRTIFAEYNPHRNSIDVYTSAGYMLRIDCWEAEKNLKTTPGSDCALNALAIDEPLEYARLYLDGTMQMWVDAEDSLDLFVPIILYFFTSDNADETFKFGIFQYHCSVFFTRQGTVSILFVRIFPCYSIIISLIEIFLIFSEYIYIIIS